jgi:hypothetical protein
MLGSRGQSAPQEVAPLRMAAWFDVEALVA